MLFSCRRPLRRKHQITDQEAFMTPQIKEQQQKPAQTPPSPLEEMNKQKQKTEELEVAGRHRNDGQKYHKGAR
jgi:hypothetical protein